MEACVSFVRFSPWKSRSPLRPGEGGSLDRSLAWKLFIEAHAAICVPSTEKCSSDNSTRTCLWFRSSARNLRATSASSSRSRFFVNTVGTHTGSSTPRPTNQHLVDDAADQPQWMVSGYSLFKVHIGEQFTRPHIRTAHRFLLLSSPA